MTGPLLALALAATPEILLPPWPLSPDGERVAVRGEATLAAEGAAVEPAGPGLFVVIPAAGATRVTLRAGPAEVVAPVEPPPWAVEIAVRPAAPVKGRDREVELDLHVRRDGGEPDAEAPAPIVVASSGRVGALAAAGPGRFRARYEPAPTRHPEVAVLLALVPRCPSCPTPRAVGYAILPLAAAVDLPGRSEPGARTTVTIGGRAHGPAVADARGRFSVPVVIPPGVQRASAISVDALGNPRATELDLELPDVDRLACAAWPRALPADGRSEAGVWCVASTASGAPAEGAALALAAEMGDARSLRPARGPLQHARWRAPRGGGGREVVLRATYPEGGPSSADEVRVGLATGPPAQLAATLAHEPVPHGAEVAAETAARDERGDVLGRPAGPPGATDGFVAPDRYVAPRAGAMHAAPLSFALAPGGEVTSLALRPDGPLWVAEARTVDARPAAGVALRFGGGAAATTDARGEARAAGPRHAETVLAPGGARAAGWAGIEAAASPFEIGRTVEVPLRPAAPVDVLAWVEGGALRWRIDGADGRPIASRPVALRADGVVLGPAEEVGAEGRATIRGGRGVVAVVDSATGIAAVVEVR